MRHEGFQAFRACTDDFWLYAQVWTPWGRHGFDGGAEALVACTSAKDDANTFGNQNSQQQRCRSRGLKNR
jgi:hypothetical protein